MKHIKDIIKLMNITNDITFGSSKDYIKIIRNYRLRDTNQDIKEVMSRYLDFEYWKLYTIKGKDVASSYYPHNLIIIFGKEDNHDYYVLVKG